MIKIYLLFYMCHFAMGLTHCYKTTVFLHLYIDIGDIPTIFSIYWPTSNTNEYSWAQAMGNLRVERCEVVNARLWAYNDQWCRAANLAVQPPCLTVDYDHEHGNKKVRSRNCNRPNIERFIRQVKRQTTQHTSLILLALNVLSFRKLGNIIYPNGVSLSVTCMWM